VVLCNDDDDNNIDDAAAAVTTATAGDVHISCHQQGHPGSNSLLQQNHPVLN